MMNEHFYINRICKPNADGTIRRYHESKAEWGVSRLLSLDVFNDIFMGYLVDDCCISGSEVFVIKYNNRNDHISLYLKVADTTSLPFGWEVNAQFSFLELDQLRDKYLTIWNYTPFLSVKDRMEGAPVALLRRFQRCFYGISH